MSPGEGRVRHMKDRKLERGAFRTAGPSSTTSRVKFLLPLLPGSQNVLGSSPRLCQQPAKIEEDEDE